MAGAVVTPGFAQPRSELPWLPYGENDRVIINSHNFTPAGFNPAVNGKTPHGVWCPTRDDAGNDTTTLTDLIGTSNGTLTNMATPASNWVEDTGAGGVRAISFDGSNDYVASMGSQNLALPLSWSVWVKPISGQFNQVGGQGNGAGTGLYLTIGDSGGVFWYPLFSGGAVGSTTGNAWNHICGTYDGTTAKLFINGSQAASTTTWGRSDAASNLEFGRVIFNTPFYGGSGMRIDDFRRWNVGLNGSDVSFLYALGAGRGISS